ncbi:hypothetical protein BSM4216_3710 [Bacillus smithii]|nr:hypothetical protein BSM4216_3710 [Bacillus smithii]
MPIPRGVFSEETAISSKKRAKTGGMESLSCNRGYTPFFHGKKKLNASFYSKGSSVLANVAFA